MTASRSTVEGWFKQRYGKIEHAIPDFAIAQRRVKFRSDVRLGDYFNFPVFLTRSHGYAFNGSSPGTAFTLTTPVTALSKNAQVRGAEALTREYLAYGALAAAAGGGEASFGALMTEYVMQLKETHAFINEDAFWYGQSATGSGTFVGQLAAEAGTTTQQFQVTKSQWAPGFWAQMNQGYIDVHAAGFGTKRNAAGTLLVAAVDFANRLITLTGTESEMDSFVSTDVVTLRGSVSATTPTYERHVGVDRIMTNTGTLFNIAGGTYSAWLANTLAIGSVRLTMAHILQAAMLGYNRGLVGKIVATVSPYGWIDMMDDMAGLRRFVEDTKMGMSMGTESITFHGLTGAIEVLPHPMIKAGEAFVGPLDDVARIGTTDSTFKIPGATGQGENMYTELPDSAGCQIRCYSDLGIIIPQPAKWTKITGIVNNSLKDAAEETTAMVT